MTPAEQGSVAAFAPGVAPVAFGQRGGPGTASAFRSVARAAGARWQITSAVPFLRLGAGTFAPLEPALRQVNFRASLLTPLCGGGPPCPGMDPVVRIPR